MLCTRRPLLQQFESRNFWFAFGFSNIDIQYNHTQFKLRAVTTWSAQSPVLNDFMYRTLTFCFVSTLLPVFDRRFNECGFFFFRSRTLLYTLWITINRFFSLVEFCLQKGLFPRFLWNHRQFHLSNSNRNATSWRCE